MPSQPCQRPSSSHLIPPTAHASQGGIDKTFPTWLFSSTHFETPHPSPYPHAVRHQLLSMLHKSCVACHCRRRPSRKMKTFSFSIPNLCPGYSTIHHRFFFDLLDPDGDRRFGHIGRNYRDRFETGYCSRGSDQDLCSKKLSSPHSQMITSRNTSSNLLRGGKKRVGEISLIFQELSIRQLK
ncbi:MAG: hypothetical protein J3Q66DRAFT_132587 [Benniella sp.]|nr:MAG: hypothetical protein J3Q66DRAFT_132587 [Benniella sp.]